MNLERSIFASIAASTAVTALVTLAIAGGRPAESVAIGGVIALLNLWALRGIVSVLVHAAAEGSGGGLGFFVVPKLIALFGLVWLLLARGIVSAGPLALGYAALPIGVAIGALVCKKGPESE